MVQLREKMLLLYASSIQEVCVCVGGGGGTLIFS